MSKIVKLETLSLSVTYKVSYGMVKMPKVVYDQIKRAEMKADPITMDKYPDAAEWMSNHVSERHCLDWKAELDVVE